jgi:hypothetical protein
MIFPILVFMIVSGVASPAPEAAPDGPLREIGHVRATMCGALVVHANGAISAALHDDLLIARTIGRLRASNLEDNALDRHTAMTELDRLAQQLHDSEVQGNGEIKRLRDMAAKSGDATQKTELRTFADALGGALNRQRKIADDLTGLLSYLSYQEMVTPSESDVQSMRTNATEFAGAQAQVQALADAQHTGGGSFDHASPNQLLQQAATEFQGRMPDVQRDEARAADHSEGAVSGC